ncbi:hypothetical protein [Methanosarcina siciliae]|nr:hypothetical protein [Methanosarcina siciliae]
MFYLKVSLVTPKGFFSYSLYSHPQIITPQNPGCHHTCGNSLLEEYIEGVMSVPGVVDEETAEKYKELMQEAMESSQQSSDSSWGNLSGVQEKEVLNLRWNTAQYNRRIFFGIRQINSSYSAEPGISAEY